IPAKRGDGAAARVEKPSSPDVLAVEVRMTSPATLRRALWSLTLAVLVGLPLAAPGLAQAASPPSQADAGLIGSGGAPLDSADVDHPTQPPLQGQSPQSGQVLRYGTPRQAQLLDAHVARMMPDVRAGLEPSPRWQKPLYPGAVALVARHGVIALHEAAGKALRYGSSSGVELPESEQIPMRRDTIFDMASISKQFTAVVAMQQVEDGLIELDDPVADHIPEFAQNGKQGVTLRHLLTHTAGLPPGLNLGPYPTIEERLAAVYAVGLRAAPGASYVYSDLSLIVLGKVLERVAGKPLDVLVAKGITEPLGLRDTMHNPPASLRPRIAPTEWQEGGRGLVWGEVHDRTSWLLGGTAGHAGVFSTAYDLAVFAQTLLNGGRHGDVAILRPESVREMWRNHNAALGEGAQRGLGFDMYRYSFMGPMATPGAVGHTGYTGPSWVIDPATDAFAILLTNRVHPHRSWSDVGPARRALGGHLARAIAVRPAEGNTAWFADNAPETGEPQVSTLTLPVRADQGAATLRFQYWWDTEPDEDVATLEVSSDQGATWAPAPITLGSGGAGQGADGTVSGYQGRRWLSASAELPAGATHVRWRYATDQQWLGRGVYVDAVQISTPERVVFDDSRPADQALWDPDGFTRSEN
ncbi:MAG: serine hydrolase, partial [Micromonosporaceae bacterium]